MPARVKRTYNLAPTTVRRVREMAERYHLASSQDGVVELAVDELERRLLETQEADAWSAAASDPAFAAESDETESVYRAADRETWPA